MNIRIIFLTFCIFLISIVNSQNAILKGFITDENGEGIIQATVIVDVSKNQATTSGIKGDYELKLPAGEYLVLYKSLSKKDKTVKIILKPGETTIQNVLLEDKAEMINQVVVTASKYAKKISEETVSVEVLSNEIIESNNIIDAENALTKVPGVTVTEGQANIRGGSGWSYGAGTRVMVLYDGLPLISPEGGDAKWSFMPMENVEQIEVIKGAASSIYGSGALNGVINIRTGYAKKDPVTKVSIYAGAFASPPNYEGAWWLKEGNQVPFQAGFTLLHKRKIKRFDLVLHTSMNQEKSTLRNADGGFARLGFKLRYRFKKLEGLSIGINSNFMRTWGKNFFLWNGDGDQQRIAMPGTQSNYQNIRWTVDPFINYRDKKGNQFSYKFRYFNATNNSEGGLGSVPLNYFNELQYNRYFKKLKFNIVTGMVVNYSTIRSATDDVTETLTGEFNSFNVAPYIQLEKKLIGERLNLTFGARYEYFNLKSVHFETDGLQKTSLDDENRLERPLFRAGANFKAAKATFLRASFGEGYRFPSIAESFVNLNLGGIQVFPNQNLQSESGWYGEVGVKQGFKIGDWQGYGDAAFFFSRYEDMIEAQFGQFGSSDDDLFGLGFSFQNIGNTQILGGDFTFASEGKIGNFPLRILMGYTYTHPTSLDWDKEVVLYNKDGKAIEPGEILFTGEIDLGTGPILIENFAIQEHLPIASNGGATTYAGTSSSNTNILKYRSRHTFTLDAQTSYKKFDFGIGLQFRSKFENIDYFFMSPFLTDDISNPENFLEQAVLDALKTGKPDSFLGPDDNTIESGIGTTAFSGIRSYEERTASRAGITLLDLRVSYHLSDNASVSLIGKNLLNMNYAIRPAIMGDPLQVQIKFAYKLTHKKKK